MRLTLADENSVRALERPLHPAAARGAGHPGDRDGAGSVEAVRASDMSTRPSPRRSSLAPCPCRTRTRRLPLAGREAHRRGSMGREKRANSEGRKDDLLGTGIGLVAVEIEADGRAGTDANYRGGVATLHLDAHALGSAALDVCRHRATTGDEEVPVDPRDGREAQQRDGELRGGHDTPVARYPASVTAASMRSESMVRSS